MRHLLLAAAIAFAAILATPAAAQPASSATLHIALREDPDMLDPSLARTVMGRIVFAGLCDKLFDINEKLQIIPQLATGHEWADSRTLVIHLRNGVLFQDGTALDAAAVKYSLERHLTMPGSSRRGEIISMDHVEVIDPTTVRIVLKNPSAPFLSQLTDRAGMIVSPKAAAAAGKDFALHPVCAGPFSFTERVAQDRIVLDRFEKYWNAPAIHFGRVIYQPIVNSATRLANLQAGAVDLAEYIVPSDVDAVKHDPKLQLFLSDALGYWDIDINVGHGARASSPIGQDVRVRQALSLAIDRTALIQVVYNGMYTPIGQGVAPSSPFYAPDVPAPAHDVEKARALLKATGLKLPVPVDLMLANNSDVQQVGEVIQAMAAEVGFDIKLNTMEFASTLAVADRGDFQAYLSGWSGRTDPDGNLWSFLHSNEPNNYPGYASRAMDDDLEQGRLVSDLAERQKIYADIARRTATDLPVIYLYVPRNIAAMSTKLTGFVPVPDGLIRLQGLSLRP
jgi:peptide/nickel transport system substrate-binding protein